MGFYTGKGLPGADNFEINKFEGFPVSKCGNYWGSDQESADNAWRMNIPLTRKERRYASRKKN